MEEPDLPPVEPEPVDELTPEEPIEQRIDSPAAMSEDLEPPPMEVDEPEPLMSPEELPADDTPEPPPTPMDIFSPPEEQEPTQLPVMPPQPDPLPVEDDPYSTEEFDEKQKKPKNSR